MLNFIYLSFMFVSILFGFAFVKKQSQISFKLLLIFLIVSFCNEIFCYYLLHKLSLSTIKYYNFYYYFRFVFLGSIFYTLFRQYKKIYKILYLLFCLLTISLFFYCFNKYDGMEFQYAEYFFAGCCFIIFSCLLYLLDLYQRSDDIPLLDNLFFISTIALLIYFIGVMPFTGIINYMVKKNAGLAVYQKTISQSLSIVFYSLLAFDFYIQWKNLKLKY